MAKIFLNVRMSGAAAAPDSVRASDLAKFLAEAEKAIQETFQAHRVELPTEPLISLVDVKAGNSVDYRLAIEDVLQDSSKEITHAIAAGQFNRLPLVAWESLAEISKMAVRRGYEIEFLLERGANGRAVISHEHEVPRPEEANKVVGTTTLYGRCVRVGGVSPKVELQLLDGRRLSISLTEEMAKQLAHRLYEDVGIIGKATWSAENWIVLEFQATQLVRYEPSSLPKAFRGLAAAAKGRWDGINAEEYVRDLRAEDEQ